MNVNCELSTLAGEFMLSTVGVPRCRRVTLICSQLLDSSSYHFVLTLTSLDADGNPELNSDNTERVRISRKRCNVVLYCAVLSQYD